MIHRKAAAFDYTGPAASLLTGLVSKKQPYLAKGAGAFLVLQWTNLNWDIPDLIVPVPRPVRQMIRVGYDHNALLAQEVSRLLEVPFINALTFDDDETPPFRPKRKLDDKSVLLIADTTQLIAPAAEGLMEAFPGAISGLAFCYESV